MEEKYLITFDTIQEFCMYQSGDGECWHWLNLPKKCSKETCPILKTLERPSVQITPVRGK